MLALVFPLVLLAFVEVGLRLAGCGHPTGFFLKTRQDGKEVWIENQRFGWRFFPPALARTPEPLVVPVVKPPQTVRIFVFGESAALGDPAPDYGFSRVLEVLLREQYPGVGFEVINVAMTAINSHAIREIARDCASLRGDVWIVYMGNNEVVGPYGAGTVFTSRSPGLPVIRASLALKATRLGQWVDGLRNRRRPFADWEGMEMFLKQQVPEDDPKMKAVYHCFEQNLDDVLHLGVESGARVLLSTVAVNLKDCPPFASRHRPGLTDAQRAEWQQLYDTGNRLLAEQRPAEALAQFQSAEQRDGAYAELPFRAGQCLLALGRAAEARASFNRARDLDTLRFRADSRINEIIRQAAKGLPSVTLLDAVAVLDQPSTNGIAGDEFFYEHVHLNFEGNYLLARRLLAELGPLLPEWAQRKAAGTAPPLAAEECARRLALTDWNRLQTADEVRKRLQQPPFTNQLGHAERDRRWGQTLAQLKEAGTPAGLQKALATARAAVQRSPSDWRLRSNLARLLEAILDGPGAIREWQEVRRLVPHDADALYHLGNLAEGGGRSVEVETYFREALRIKPDAVEVLNGLGLVLAADGRTAEAIQQFEQALRLKPRFVEARANLGQVLASLGRADEARAQYEAALGQDTNCFAAHINLGKLLSAQGRKDDAAQHYREALRIKPSDPVAHYNLGNALGDLGRHGEALDHYAAAVRAKPDFAEARFNLGHELARQARPGEALEHFSEAVRLKPDWVEARFNLGVALARQRRFEEAAAQFRETLRLQPQHPSARQYLDEAVRLGRNR